MFYGDGHETISSLTSGWICLCARHLESLDDWGKRGCIWAKMVPKLPCGLKKYHFLEDV